MAFKEAIVDFFSSDAHASSNNKKNSESSGSVKEKIMKTWNNIKYDFSSAASLDINSSLWLLGNHYYPLKDCEPDSERHIEEFITDFTSKAWFTYRSNFPCIAETNITTDTGWGCMIRSGQMMLAQALFRYLIGNQYNWVGKKTPFDRLKHEQILRWFFDSPAENCPFSVHRLASIGKVYGNSPGDWYGPNTMAYMLQHSVDNASKIIPELSNLKVIVAQDCTVYIEDVKTICNWSNDAAPSSATSLIILIPVRLGKTLLNPIYIPSLCSLFTLDNCIGIIGGKPNHSVYFVGFQEEYLFYLEPHYCQKADDPNIPRLLLRNYHTHIPRKMNVKKMDPSCCLGFYCKDFNEFQQLQKLLSKITSPPNLQAQYPFCTFAAGKAEDHYYYKIDSKSEEQKENTSQTLTEETFATNFDNQTKHLPNQIAPKVNSKAKKKGESSGKLSKFIDGIRTSTSNKPLERLPSDNEFEIL